MAVAPDAAGRVGSGEGREEGMSDRHAPPPTDPRAGLIEDFTRSELFDHTFREGMDLVDETARYLDGAGRQEAKRLSRAGALAYAAESMRLTTRLMQVASWLLVQRAVREGDMAAEAAGATSYRLGPEPAPARIEGPGAELPQPLNALLERSSRLYERICHLDRRMYEDAVVAPFHPVLAQLERLKCEFGA
jgi:regulator of CtrA degradation